MDWSNTETPRYYGEFRRAVLDGDIPVCREISLEMARIDALIANPAIYYVGSAMDGFVDYCESELTLTDGEDLKLLDTFKLWSEQVFCWWYFEDASVYEPYAMDIGLISTIDPVRKFSIPFLVDANLRLSA